MTGQIASEILALLYEVSDLLDKCPKCFERTGDDNSISIYLSNRYEFTIKERK